MGVVNEGMGVKGRNSLQNISPLVGFDDKFDEISQNLMASAKLAI